MGSTDLFGGDERVFYSPPEDWLAGLWMKVMKIMRGLTTVEVAMEEQEIRLDEEGNDWRREGRVDLATYDEFSDSFSEETALDDGGRQVGRSRVACIRGMEGMGYDLTC